MIFIGEYAILLAYHGILSTKGEVMRDIHTHILPGIDDGSRDLYDSMEMAAMAADGGTTVMVATPHCNIPGVYDNYFGKEYIELFRKTVRELERNHIPVKHLPGMEVYSTFKLPRLLAEGKIITLNKSRYLLMEFDFQEDPDFADRILDRVREARAVPVIAHAERYAFVQDDPEIVYRWLGKGYAVQINKGSFMGRFGRTAQRTAFELLDHNLVTVVASDAHSPYQRTPWMQDVYESLLEEYPRDYLEALFTENPGRICRGQEVIRFRRISFQDTYQI